MRATSRASPGPTPLRKRWLPDRHQPASPAPGRTRAPPPAMRSRPAHSRIGPGRRDERAAVWGALLLHWRVIDRSLHRQRLFHVKQKKEVVAGLVPNHLIKHCILYINNGFSDPFSHISSHIMGSLRRTVVRLRRFIGPQKVHNPCNRPPQPERQSLAQALTERHSLKPDCGTFLP